MMFSRIQWFALWSVFFLLLMIVASHAEDWPMWRYDPGRTAAAPAALSMPLHLYWVRELPPAKPAWPASQYKLQFDVCYEPVAAEGLLFVPSNVSDCVTAYDMETGAERWRFYADAPVRFAPVTRQGKVWFVSDDGYLYCLKASNGNLIWKFRGGPGDQKVIGNHRLVSSWPARGAPVLKDGKLYFAASIWPFMGIFYHALDTETGEVLWTNSGSGSDWRQQPHGGAISFSNLVPQGYFVITGEDLIAPGGRSTPGVLNLKTGVLEHFVWPQMGGGGPVYANGEYYYNAGSMRSASDGEELVKDVHPSVLTDAAIISVREDEENQKTVIVFQTPNPLIEEVEKTNRRGKKYIARIGSLPETWEISCNDAPSQLFLKAGSQYFFGGENRIACFEIDSEVIEKTGSEARKLWTMEIDGTPGSMLVADQKLFVITYEGRIYCFGPDPVRPARHPHYSAEDEVEHSLKCDWDRKFFDRLGIQEGYCLVLGAGTGQVAEELVRHFQFSVVVLDPDREKVDALRRKWTNAGLYGERLSILPEDILSAHLPPYLASLIVIENLEPAQFQSEEFLSKVFQALRPYGGMACIPVIGTRHLYIDWIEKAHLSNARLGWVEDTLLLVRSGPLPGSSDWTHHYCDSANSVTSKDQLVKAPLGLLWFGGPSNDKILPRHGHGPSPQVVGGRLFIEGPDIIRAVDVYTGRLLWERELKGIGEYYDNTSHQPGAGEIGSNYVSLQDGIYVTYGSAILRLNPATGETLQTFSLPAEDGNPPNWGYLGVWENLLIATSSPLSIHPPDENESQPTPIPEETRVLLDKIQGVETNARFAPSSKQLLVMNRQSGKILWTRRAAYSFRHNAIVAAAGKIFCIDALTPEKLDYLRRRGYANPSIHTLYALKIETGKEIWKTSEDVFGTWLGYSEEYDVLIQAGSANADRARDEAKKGIVVYRGEDGSVLWKSRDLEYRGPLMLHHDLIITNGFSGWSMKLLTGEKTGWTWKRTYGCNHAIAGEHLMTFRSGAAGYNDLTGDSGTGNLGGFKSGCTSNLIPANGVLNAPDYTRTCICAYQNQSSLAFVHDPEVEMWTFGGSSRPGTLGINLGAPGNRRAPNGTLWLDFPNVGGDPETVALELEPEEPSMFRYHASRIEEGDLKWIAASGVKGVTHAILTLDETVQKPGKYQVRLVFAEVEDIRPGQRLFDVSLQGEPALRDFDILKTAGGMNRSVIKEFAGIEIQNQLVIDLTPQTADNSYDTVLCGIEVLAEGIK